MRLPARLVPWVLGLPCLVYLLLPTRNFYWDGVAFAIAIEKQLPMRELLHPNHLLYTVAALSLYRTVLAAGLHIRALFLMQTANCLLAGAAVVLVCRALRRRMLSTEAAVVGTLSFAFAATWWRFATDANAYIPSIVLLLCANDLLESKRSAPVAALVHAGAMLFHELAIFYLPVVWFRRRSWRGRFAYGVAALGPVAVAYGIAYRTVFATFDLPGFLRWIVAYTPDAGFSFQPARNLLLTVWGTVRLFVGGKLGEAVPGAVTVIGIVILAAAVVATVVRWRRPRFAFPPRDLLLWAGVTAGFLFFWMPQNTFYRLFYLAPLVVLIACCIKRGPALMCAVLFAWNLVFLIYPQSRIENNSPLRFALAQHDRWPPGTPIVFSRFHPDLWTISYFNQQASWIGMDRLDFAVLEKGLAWAHERGQPLWIEGTAYNLLSADARGKQWLAGHEVPSGALIFSDAKHEYRFCRAE